MWEDNDPDSNALISIYYDTDEVGEDGVLIVEGLEEDPDDTDDAYTWDITGLEGAYFIYATITDEGFSVTDYAGGSVTIDRTSPSVEALPVGGIYDSAQSVTLSADETADIYYTIDGSEPTTDSLSYTLPIEITETTTLKFMAVDNTGNQSETITELYTIETAANVPPNAIAGGDITVILGSDAGLDGSASNDPDDGPEPLNYLWRFVSLPSASQLTDDDITEADTPFASFTPDQTGTYELELMVGDGDAYGYDNLLVIVEESGPEQTIFDLEARAKDGKVQLIWTLVDSAECYNVYRKTSGSEYDKIVDCHVTTYCTYLDLDVVNGTTYFYIVRSVTQGVESGDSNEASATPQERRRR